MPALVDPVTLKRWLRDGGEIALFDVREAGQFGEGHPFHAVPLPYSRLELDIARLAPRRSVRLVLLDDGDGVAMLAAARLENAGYSDVHVLAGGVMAWRRAGYNLFEGVNVVSKTFGELVAHHFKTPSIGAEELQARLARGDNLLIVDGRPAEEYRRMSIPGAVCCPNGELAYRIAALAPDPATTIVVNCAGRTRSIIGAETLRQFGPGNPVLALRNGTMGWRLAGFALDPGGNRLYPAAPPVAERDACRRKAVTLAAQRGIPLLDVAKARHWLTDARRTTYLFDIRTEEEFAAGHPPGAIHAPGGQLLQATDQWVGVRGARLILADEARIRAVAVAFWLRLMGHDAAVLNAGPAEWADLPGETPVGSPVDALPVLPEISPDALAGKLSSARHLDLRPSMAYRQAHIAGARWAIRPRAGAAVTDMPAHGLLVLVASEPDIARAFATELEPAQRRRAVRLSGGPDDWRRAGLPLAASPSEPSREDCIDFLFFAHDRHAGNLQAARQYLAWETGLLDRLDADERAGFRLGQGSD